MIRTREWKYIRRLREPDELYDLTDDPGELRNVSGDPRYAGTIRMLQNRIALWYLETVDVVPFGPVMEKLRRLR